MAAGRRRSFGSTTRIQTLVVAEVEERTADGILQEVHPARPEQETVLLLDNPMDIGPLAKLDEGEVIRIQLEYDARIRLATDAMTAVCDEASGLLAGGPKQILYEFVESGFAVRT